MKNLKLILKANEGVKKEKMFIVKDTFWVFEIFEKNEKLVSMHFNEKENPSKKFRRHAYAYLKKEICNRVGENPNPPVELKKIIRPGTNHFF